MLNREYFAAVQRERSCRTKRVCLVLAILLALLAMKELETCKIADISPAVSE